MTITNAQIQQDIIAYTKTLTAVISLLDTAEEVRELEWQGTVFQYPNIRVSVDVYPDVSGCFDKATIHFDCFAEDKSSYLAQQIAGAIQTAYHRVPFSQNGRQYFMSVVIGITRANRSIYAWVSNVEVSVMVN